jgi:light-regulated signal transduction histidine kinase (bacteriophytochrome)
MRGARSPATVKGLIATVLLALAIFIADSVTPVTVAAASVYVLVVLLGSRFCQPSGVVIIAAGCAALTLLSYFISPPGGDPIRGIINTCISIAIIALTTGLIVKDQTREILRQELAKRAAELEAANKELESFAYSVSHDLRAPLRHIGGYAELLQKQASSTVDEKSRRYIKTIQESAKRMGNLIDDLLSLSRVGRTETRNTVVNLEQVAKEVIAELGEETSGRDIVWKIAALPACYGDRPLLKLVLANLISNAVKFTRARSRAEIEIGCASRDGNKIEVFVRDNGVGFDARYANKLFGVFQRLHSADEFEGTGIGLATVQRVIHRHGGDVRAEGALDQGATFYFSVLKA